MALDLPCSSGWQFDECRRGTHQLCPPLPTCLWLAPLAPRTRCTQGNAETRRLHHLSQSGLDCRLACRFLGNELKAGLGANSPRPSQPMTRRALDPLTRSAHFTHSSTLHALIHRAAICTARLSTFSKAEASSYGQFLRNHSSWITPVQLGGKTLAASNHSQHLRFGLTHA